MYVYNYVSTFLIDHNYNYIAIIAAYVQCLHLLSLYPAICQKHNIKLITNLINCKALFAFNKVLVINQKCTMQFCMNDNIAN